MKNIFDLLSMESKMLIPRLTKTNMENVFEKKNSYASDTSRNIIGLNLSGAKLNDVSFLKDFETIQYLELSCNNIRDFSCLRDLKNLIWLNLKNNEISELPFDILNWDMDIKWASEYPNGLILQGNPLNDELIQAIKKGRKFLIQYFQDATTSIRESTEPPIEPSTEPSNVPNETPIYKKSDSEILNRFEVQSYHSKDTILVLSANPKDTNRIRFDEEFREVEEGIRLSKYGSQYEIVPIFAVRYRDIRRALLNFEPNIVHFIGHGERDGLKIESEGGKAEFLKPRAISSLLRAFRGIKCVILNACYSEVQAKFLRQHIDYVIGMRDRLPDKAGIQFAVGFFDTLGAGKSIEMAFEIGRAALDHEFPDIPISQIPVLIKK